MMYLYAKVYFTINISKQKDSLYNYNLILTSFIEMQQKGDKKDRIE